MAGHSGQFTPGGYVSAVIHTKLAGVEPTTFRLLVRRASSPVGLRVLCSIEYRVSSLKTQFRALTE